VTGAVDRLSNTTGLDNHVLSQVGILVKELCKAQCLPEPVSDLQKLATAMTNDPTVSTSDPSSSKRAPGSGNSTDNGSSEEMDIEYEFDDDDDDDEDDGVFIIMI
jgi:ubiquitin-conjugating enzyme E2 Q